MSNRYPSVAFELARNASIGPIFLSTTRYGASANRLAHMYPGITKRMNPNVTIHANMKTVAINERSVSICPKIDITESGFRSSTVIPICNHPCAKTTISTNPSITAKNTRSPPTMSPIASPIIARNPTGIPRRKYVRSVSPRSAQNRSLTSVQDSRTSPPK